MPGGHEQQVTAGVGIRVQDGNNAISPPDHVALVIGKATGQDPAEDTIAGAEGRPPCSHVLGPPARPQPIQSRARCIAHGWTRCPSTSARKRRKKSSNGTSRSTAAAPRALTPTVPAATSSPPTTST